MSILASRLFIPALFISFFFSTNTLAQDTPDSASETDVDLCICDDTESMPAVSETDSRPYYADYRKNHFYTSLGFFWPTIDTNARIENKSTGIAPSLDFESDLGLQDKRALWQFFLGYQFYKNHFIELGYFQLNRDGERVIFGNGNVGEIEYQAGAIMETKLDIDIYQINYGYSFYKTDKWGLAGMLGMYWYKIDAALNLNGYVQVGSSSIPIIDAGDTTSTSSSFNAPLPTIGFHLSYNITPDWKIQSRLMWFDASIGDYSGSINNLYFGIRKNITGNVFAGFNYNIFDVSVKRETANTVFDFQYLYQGPTLYVGYQI